MGIKLLLDTHALVWWWTDDARLPLHGRSAIADPNNTIHVGAASAWEITAKHPHRQMTRGRAIDRRVSHAAAPIPLSGVADDHRR